MSAWNHIWDQSPPDSTIRRVLIDIYLARLPPCTFEHHLNEWPSDLILAAARLHFKGESLGIKERNRQCPSFEDREKYHEPEVEDEEVPERIIKQEAEA